MHDNIVLDRYGADGFKVFNHLLKELSVGPYLAEPPLILEDGRLLVILVTVDDSGKRRIVGRLMLFPDMSVEYGEVLKNFDDHEDYVESLSQIPEVAEFIHECFAAPGGGPDDVDVRTSTYSLDEGAENDETSICDVTDPRIHLWEQKAWFYEATFGTRMLSRVDSAVVEDIGGSVEFDEVQDNLHIHFQGASGRVFWAIVLSHEDLCLLYEANRESEGKFDFRGLMMISRLWDYFDQLPNLYAFLEDES